MYMVRPSWELYRSGAQPEELPGDSRAQLVVLWA